MLAGRNGPAAQLAAKAASLFSDNAWGLANVFLPVLRERERLRVYASVGLEEDSIRALWLRVDSLLSAWYGTELPQGLRYEVLDMPAWLAFPHVGETDVHRGTAGDDLIELQWLLARGDTAGLSVRLDSVTSLRRGRRPGDVAVSRTYQEAWLMLQLGDTAGAVARLEAAVGPLALPIVDGRLVRSPMEAGAFVRSMALQAELAFARGDSAVAASWAQRVVSLWSDGDAAAQAVVRRMESIILGDGAR